MSCLDFSTRRQRVQVSTDELQVIRIPVDQLWNNWETRPKGVGKRMTVRSGGTEAKRRGCNGLTGIHMTYDIF